MDEEKRNKIIKIVVIAIVAIIGTIFGINFSSCSLQRYVQRGCTNSTIEVTNPTDIGVDSTNIIIPINSTKN